VTASLRDADGEPFGLACVLRQMAKLRIPRLKVTRRGFLRFAAGTGGLAAATGFYTWRIEPHWLQIVERPLPVVNLPSALEGARLAQLSDLHIGPRVEDDYVLSVFARVRALAPEIVVYTGDFTSYAPDVMDHTRRVFAALPNGTRGTVGVLGNHDYGPEWGHSEVADGIAELAGKAGVQILRNEIADVAGLQIVGLDEFWAGRFSPSKAFAKLDPSLPAIALSHNPDTADEPGWEKHAGWILAGHTHGGQCKAPFLPPPLLPVRNRRYTSGEFDLSGGRRMYINRGVGHLLRVRINARPEVTMFQLARA
jgi:uncharacterized protein